MSGLDPEALAAVESMVTAVLAADAGAQALVADGMTPREEALTRADAAIIAGAFLSIGRRMNAVPATLWRAHMANVARHREARRG